MDLLDDMDSGPAPQKLDRLNPQLSTDRQYDSNAAHHRQAVPFQTPRDAARAILRVAWAGETTITPKGGQFVGQLSVSDEALSDRQIAWLEKLLSKAGLPPVHGGLNDR